MMIINTIYSDVNKNHDKTIIMITHRRESIIRCDRLYVLNQVVSRFLSHGQGNLIEEGGFDELMKKKGYFYNLFNTATYTCLLINKRKTEYTSVTRHVPWRNQDNTTWLEGSQDP